MISISSFLGVLICGAAYLIILGALNIKRAEQE